MRYYLKVRTETANKTDKTCQIQLYYVNKTLAPLKLDTTVRVLPINFKDDQVTENDKDHISKNIVLSHCLLTAQEIRTKFFTENKRNPTPNEFRLIYEQRIEQGDVKSNLFELYDYWIKEINTNKDKRLYNTILRSLKEHFPPTLTLGDLNAEVLQKIRNI